ncbi:uncharacterized protein LOC141850520 [Brevipalpus obovatus]|uniref:uncharacterized protein LOC141850520 n=1 Tax=Brevipalpus obovatus TaxID=246614 RepID=UPI003D9DE3FE
MAQWIGWIITLIIYISPAWGIQICPRSSATFVQMMGYKALDKILKNLDEFENRTISECHDLCVINDRCVSFFADNVRNQCFLVNTTSANLVSQSLEKHSNWSFHRKVCPPSGCEAADVQFELLSGSLLVTNAFKVTRDLDPHRCLELCKNEPSCLSVNIDYKKGACSFSNHNLRTSGADQTMEANPYFNYFEKICLPVTNRCTTDWAFERVKGKELVGMPFDKVLVDASSREECEAACLEYQAFPCRSAEYNYQMNECRLSPYNRFSSEDKRVRLESSASLVDYLENNCAKGPRGFCSWKIVKQNRMVQQDRIFLTDSIVKCQEECLQNPNFICRSFNYDPISRTCSLSHHSRRSVSGTGLMKSPSSIVYEVSTCFDVSIECEPNVMRAKVISNTLFQGKLYARERPSSCFVDVSNSMEFSIPIGLKGDDCGTVVENEGTFANILVIQSNDHVMTAFDKAVGVRCTYEVGNITGETILHINEMNKTDHKRNSPTLPDLSLHILDQEGSEKDVVSLGELLRVQVRMSDEDTYGIFVRNLIAKDKTGSNNLTLIDHHGCPIEAKLMREVRTLDHQKALESEFEAFSFTGSSSLELEAEVETCLDRCRPVQCRLASGRSEDDDFEVVVSYGRRRRSAGSYGEALDTRFLSKSVTITAPRFSLNGATEKLSAQRKNLIVKKPIITKSSDEIEDIHEETNDLEDSLMAQLLPYQTDQRTGFLCFEPSALTTISGATLLIQVVFLTVAIYMGLRIGREKSSREGNFFNVY